MSTRPWMKFYPSDWLGSSRLRRCSLEARGLAIDLICLMHNGEPYGHLAVKSYAALARMVGAPRKEVVRLLTELLQGGVFVFVPVVPKSCPNRAQNVARTGHDSGHARLPKSGTIFSPRMVRDYEKHLKRQADGALGGNPAVRRVVNLNTTPEVKPSESRDQSLERKKDSCAVADATRTSEIDKKLEGEFEEFWKVKPKRKGANPRKTAFKAYRAAIRSGADPALILAAARQWATDDRDKIGTEFVPMAATWLNQGRFERDDIPRAEPAPLFEIHAGSPKMQAWKAFATKNKHRALLAELELREQQGVPFKCATEWPPGHAPLKLVVAGAA